MMGKSIESASTDTVEMKMPTENEQAWFLRGFRGPLWIGRITAPVAEGDPASVAFSWEQAWFDRAVIGHIHTHPSFPSFLSGTDMATLRAWAFATGKPLLAAVRGTDGLKAWILDNEDAAPRPVWCWMVGGIFMALDRKAKTCASSFTNRNIAARTPCKN